jgi:hypothetical protein
MHLTRIVNCDTLEGNGLMVGIMRVGYRAFICGIWMMVLRGLYCLRRVFFFDGVN